MFRRHSIAVGSMTKPIYSLEKRSINSNTCKWMQLFLSALIPLMIGVFTIVTTVLQNKISERQREQDKYEAFLIRQHSERQADNLRQENIFAAYTDEVSKLMLIENPNQTRTHIRMKTLTTLRQLDPTHKQYVLMFLYESELIYRQSRSIIPSLLPLHRADFNDIFFEGTKETPCKLSRLYIPGVYLSNSTFRNCFMDTASFAGAIMYKANFHNTFLIRVSFMSASLHQANFSHSKLSYIEFIHALLFEADFTNTTFVYYDNAFMNTDLTRAKISLENFQNIKFTNCILPNGTWGPIASTNRLTNGNLAQNCKTNFNENLTAWFVTGAAQIRVFQYDNNTECYFRVVSFNKNNTRKVAYVNQTVLLTYFSLLISAGQAQYNAFAYVQCFGEQSIFLELEFSDQNALKYPRIYSNATSGNDTGFIQITGPIFRDAYSVRFYITFLGSKNTGFGLDDENYCICKNTTFFISKIE